MMFFSICIQAEGIDFKISTLPITTKVLKQNGVAGGEGFQLVMAIAFAPSDSNIVYMGSDTSQIWKSSNGGRTWHPINNGYYALGTCSLVVHPSNPDLVFSAGSLGKKFKRGKYLSSHQGIYRTTDGGLNWNMVHEASFFKQESRGTLFVIDSRTLEQKEFTIYSGTYSGDLLVSRDSGLSWNNTGFNKGPIQEIAESPESPGTILVATQNGLYTYNEKNVNIIGNGLTSWPRSIAVTNKEPKSIFAALGKRGVYKSSDGGLNFEPNFINNRTEEINDIEISQSNAKTLIFIKSGKGGGPFYSKDGGKNWSRAISTNSKGLTDGDGFYFPSPVAINPNNHNVVLTSSNGKAKILSSNDGGKSWMYSNSGYQGGRLRDVVDITSKKMIFLLTDHGAWQTEDGGQTFEAVTHPKKGGKSTGGGAISNKTVVLTVGSWKEKNLLVSKDSGRSWFDTGLRDKISSVYAHKDKGNVFYAGNYRSNDGGKTWNKLSYRIRAIDQFNNDIVYAFQRKDNKSQLMVSVDRGNQWQKLGTEIPIKGLLINELEIDPFSREILYAATNRGVWVYSEKKWTLRNKNEGLSPDRFGGQYYQSICAHPFINGLLFVGKRSPGVGMANGLFYSTDGGEEWKSISHEILSNTNIWSININSHDGIVYVGTSHGVYKVEPLQNKT